LLTSHIHFIWSRRLVNSLKIILDSKLSFRNSHYSKSQKKAQNQLPEKCKCHISNNYPSRLKICHILETVSVFPFIAMINQINSPQKITRKAE
jgi:hypothetical protein